MEKMEIFIIWHGRRGNAVAAALEEWLPQIVNDFKPWFSSSAQKGSRWQFEVAARLAKARAGIICLTPSALTAPWVLFETGAIAKPRDKTYACTLLIDPLKSEDVTYPLAQFTHTTTTKEDFLKLVKDLNIALGKDQLPEAQIEKSFGKWWPDLDQTLKTLPPDEPAKNPHRDQQELLAELIDLARQTNAQVADLVSRIATPTFQPVTPTVSSMVPLRLANPVYTEGFGPGAFASQVFETPFVPGGASETLAAQTSLRHASQPDELPHAQPKRHHRHRRNRPKATRESTPDKKPR